MVKPMESSREEPFWEAVRRCLEVFHGLSHDLAESSVKTYRKSLKSLPRRQYSLIFHNEPYNLANDLAGETVHLNEKYREVYSNILTEVGGAPSEAPRTRHRGR